MDQALNTTTTYKNTMKRCPTDNWKPGESMVIASVDPPQTFDGGVGIGTGALAADGGISGFPIPSTPVDDSAWCTVIEADQPEAVGDIAHLEHLLQTNKQAEGAMLFQTLHRLREALATQVKRSSDADTPISITAMDAVLLSRLLLKRLG